MSVSGRERERVTRQILWSRISTFACLSAYEHVLFAGFGDMQPGRALQVARPAGLCLSSSSSSRLAGTSPVLGTLRPTGAVTRTMTNAATSAGRLSPAWPAHLRWLMTRSALIDTRRELASLIDKPPEVGPRVGSQRSGLQTRACGAIGQYCHGRRSLHGQRRPVERSGAEHMNNVFPPSRQSRLPQFRFISSLFRHLWEFARPNS